VLLILSPTTLPPICSGSWSACLLGGVVALGSIPFNQCPGVKLLAGIVAIVLGLALISQPLFSAYLVAAMALWILGALLILAGTALVIVAFSGVGWWYGLLGGLVIVIGVLLILISVVGPLKAPWVFGVAFIVAGILAIVAAVQSRRHA
jgi:uncharacterized membrane protein HdeD (DUF308 family)